MKAYAHTAKVQLWPPAVLSNTFHCCKVKVFGHYLQGVQVQFERQNYTFFTIVHYTELDHLPFTVLLVLERVNVTAIVTGWGK